MALETDPAAAEIIIVDENPTPEKEQNSEFSSAEDKLKHLSNRSFEQDIRERRKYAVYAYKITKSWVCFLIMICIFQWFARWWDKGLHDAEFVTIITTLTASVFGFWWLVGRYLFKEPTSKNK